MNQENALPRRKAMLYYPSQPKPRPVRLREKDRDPYDGLRPWSAITHGIGAALALLVLDGSAPLSPEDEAAMAQAAHAPRVICLINKSDRPLAFAPEELRSRFPHLCVVSAATGAGLDALGETVAALFPAGGAESAGELLTNARQADAARRALEAVTRASESLEAGITPDALLTDAEEALAALGELTGASVREDVTARIFERFCVGK